jgi:hypothetical protein
MTTASAYDAVAIRDGVVAALDLRASIDHSPVWGSPFKHVYVFLSDQGMNGPLVHVSPQEELEMGHGLYAALRSSVDDTEAEAEVVDDLDELIAWVEDHQGEAAPDRSEGGCQN